LQPGFLSSAFPKKALSALSSFCLGNGLTNTENRIKKLGGRLAFDRSRQKLSNGMELVKAAGEIQPDLKVLVFSAEGKAAVIGQIFEKLGIDGYVGKARNDVRELKAAIGLIDKGQRYWPGSLRQLIGQKNAHDFTAYDVTLLSLMAQGLQQKDIPVYLRENKIEPAGLSSVEKRVKHIREALEFTSNEQLIAYCKDMGIV
jgi:two-component system capsular synthesis response regulator RcsB